MQIEKPPSLAEPPRRARPGPELPGCRPIPVRREEIATCESRFEFWDAETETAWVIRDPTGFAHEGPSQRLAGLAQLIAAVRGAPIECCGAMDLVLRNERGEQWWIPHRRSHSNPRRDPGRGRGGEFCRRQRHGRAALRDGNGPALRFRVRRSARASAQCGAPTKPDQLHQVGLDPIEADFKRKRHRASPLRTCLRRRTTPEMPRSIRWPSRPARVARDFRKM